MNVFRYKGYLGSIESSIEDNCLFGKLLFVNDLITYEAQTVAELKNAFKEAIDDYLDSCREVNKTPEKPFKGSLNIRIGPQLHKKVAFYAKSMGLSLNDYIKQAVVHQLKSDETRL